MRFLDRFLPKKKERRGYGYMATISYGSIPVGTELKDQLSLSAVYRCVEVISDSVASLPFEPLRRKDNGFTVVDRGHMTYEMLNLSPNKIQSRYTFMKTLVTHVLLHGSGYAQIVRDSNGNARSINLIDPAKVSIWKSDDGKTIKYKILGSDEYIPSYNMIHILNFSYDGITGISTLTHASLTTDIAMSADKHAKGFFAGGANLSGILQVKSGLEDGQAQEIKDKWQTALSPTTGNPNGVIILEGDDMEFKPVSIKPSDAQMLESRKYSVIDICRFFGVSPVKAFDLSSSAYNNIEQSNLSFLTDTLTPILEKIENEFNRKIFRPSETKYMESKFDVSSLMRTDLKTQAEYYSKMFNIGVFTSNEIRGKMNLEPVEGGDKAFIQGALLPIDYDFTAKSNTDNKQISAINNSDKKDEEDEEDENKS